MNDFTDNAGRIVAANLRKNEGGIEITIYQNEEDCPARFEEHFNCLNNCGGIYYSMTFDPLNRTALLKQSLMRNTSLIYINNLREAGIDEDKLFDMVYNRYGLTGIEQKGKLSFLYKNYHLIDIYECGMVQKPMADIADLHMQDSIESVINNFPALLRHNGLAITEDMVVDCENGDMISCYVPEYEQ
ncbi:MAG: hypothetical protein R6U32_03680 [Candidatus Woesearchaeota archaeon]